MGHVFWMHVKFNLEVPLKHLEDHPAFHKWLVSPVFPIPNTEFHILCLFTYTFHHSCIQVNMFKFKPHFQCFFSYVVEHTWLDRLQISSSSLGGGRIAQFSEPVTSLELKCVEGSKLPWCLHI